MGYFSLQSGESVEAYLKSALENIELWEDLETGGEYLISGFCKHQIEEALKIFRKTNETSDKELPNT